MVLFVSPSGDTEEHASTVAHELAHVLSQYVLPAQPRWFSEGLAEVLESVALERGGERWLGLRASPWEQVDPIPVRELMGWRYAGVNRECRYYQSAWALVRYLEAEQPAGSAELQRRFAAGESSEAAWNGAFPQWSLATRGASASLDRFVRSRANDKAGTRPVAATRPAPSPAERSLSAGEELTVRMAIRVRWTPEMRKELTGAALAIDPGHVRALRVLGAPVRAPRDPVPRSGGAVPGGERDLALRRRGLRRGPGRRAGDVIGAPGRRRRTARTSPRGGRGSPVGVCGRETAATGVT
jgi:hypothetical protein